MQGKPAASFHDCISLDHVVPFIFDDPFDCERLEVAIGEEILDLFVRIEFPQYLNQLFYLHLNTHE